MEMLKLRKHIGADGLLTVELPQGMANQEVEVVVVVQPLQPKALTQAEWVAFIDATAGSLADDPIERPDQGEYEIRDEIL